MDMNRYLQSTEEDEKYNTFRNEKTRDSWVNDYKALKQGFYKYNLSFLYMESG